MDQEEMLDIVLQFHLFARSKTLRIFVRVMEVSDSNDASTTIKRNRVNQKYIKNKDLIIHHKKRTRTNHP